jgi:hypothetical protein
MAASKGASETDPARERDRQWGHSLLLTLVAGIVGLVTSAYAANLAIAWYQVPAYEGTGIFFVAPFALVGVIVGFLAGLTGSRISRGSDCRER